MRYSEVEPEFFSPKEWRLQSKTNKQGSKGLLSAGLQDMLDNKVQGWIYPLAVGLYKKAIEWGVTRELARVVFPVSVYTTWYWKIDLHNLFHFLSLRLAPDAQEEIRGYAEAIADIVKEWVPDAWEAFENYRLNAITFSEYELRALRHYLVQGPAKQLAGLTLDGLCKTEKRQFHKKLKRIKKG